MKNAYQKTKAAQWASYKEVEKTPLLSSILHKRLFWKYGDSITVYVI